jgi:hypothetical protein
LVSFPNSTEPALVTLPEMHCLYLKELLLFYEAHVRLIPAADPTP